MSVARRALRLQLAWLRRAMLFLLLAAFVYAFDPTRAQQSDWYWPAALLIWCWEAIEIGGGFQRPKSCVFSRRDGALLIALLLPFAALWLPHYNNWRWVYSGDSAGWFTVAEHSAQFGFDKSLLSLWGVDDHFTFLQTHASNALMFVFDPSFFLHRLGKLFVTCCSLATIFLFLRLVVGRGWALAVALALVTNYVFLWFSFVSYPHIDSFIFYYGMLSVVVLIGRDSGRPALWVLGGAITGLSLFFTQTSWTGVAVAGVLLGVLAIRQRRFGYLCLYGLTAIVAALPIILQAGDFIAFISNQAKTIWEWSYLVRIGREVLLFPYDSSYDHIGVLGGVLRAPGGVLYLVGLATGLLALWPRIRTALHIPVAVPWLALLLLLEVVLLTLTNNGYHNPSTKRVYNLLPLQVFLATVPAAVLYRLATRNTAARLAVGGLIALSFAIYIRGNAETVVVGRQGLYGFNALDGLVEIRQRFADRKVTLFTSRPGQAEQVGMGSEFHRAYGVADMTTPVLEWSATTILASCAKKTLVCYDLSSDRERWQQMLATSAVHLQEFPLLNSTELVCFECTARSSNHPSKF